MPNDSETATYQAGRERGDGESAGDATRDSGANGYDSVSAQYNAIHEAQLAHEDIIRSLREELGQHREKLAQMEASPQAPAGPQSVDAILLRISELERKLGEGTSDPLLNEIVHRLSALERGPQGGQDARVSGLLEAVEQLKQKVEDGVGDGRTDDLVLRLASLEGSIKRSNFEEASERFEARFETFGDELRSDSESLREEIAALAKRLDAAAQGVDSEALEAVSQRIEKIEDERAEASSKADDRISEISERVAELNDESRPGSLGAQIRELEGRLEALSENGDQQDLLSRLRGVEEKLNASPQEPRIEEFEKRLADIEQAQISVGESSPETEAALGRIAVLEEKLEIWGSLGDRVSRLEDAPVAALDVGRLDGFDRRLDEIESVARDSVGSEGLALARTLESRLESMTRVGGSLDLLAERVDRMESTDGGNSRVDELQEKVALLSQQLQDLQASGGRDDDSAPRFAAIEERLGALDEITEIQSRLKLIESRPDPESTPSEALAERIQALEERGTPTPDNRETEQLREDLRRVQAQMEALAAESASPADSSEILERLEALERRPAATSHEGEVSSALLDRVSALEEARRAAGIDAAATRELFDRVEAIERSGGSGDGSAGPDPRISEIMGRLSSLEQDIDQAAAGGGSSEPDPRVDSLIARLESLESRPVSSGDGASADAIGALTARLEELESAGPAGSAASLGAELTARFEEIEGRLAGGTPGSPEDANRLEQLVQSESDRWSQWARNTLSEVGELRQQIEVLQQQGAAGAPGDTLPAQNLEALGAAISNSLSKSDVKALRSQMYFVYFTIGMLWVFGLYFLFSNMAG